MCAESNREDVPRVPIHRDPLIQLPTPIAQKVYFNSNITWPVRLQVKYFICKTCHQERITWRPRPHVGLPPRATPARRFAPLPKIVRFTEPDARLRLPLIAQIIVVRRILIASQSQQPTE